MTRPSTWIAAGTAGVAVGVLLFWWQHHGRPPSPRPEARLGAPPVATPLPNFAITVPPGDQAAPVPRIRRIDLAQRQALAAAIERARAQRLGGAAPRAPAPFLPIIEFAPDSIQASMREVIPLLAECFDQAAPRRSVHETTITATIQVSGEPDVGTLVDAVDLASDHHGLDDPEFRDCLHQTLLSVAMPPLPDGGKFEIHYPFVFRDDSP